MFPDSPFYNLPLLFTLQGIIDVNVLKLSLFDVMKKHQLLRMRLIDSYEATQEIVESDIEHLPFKYFYSTSNMCYNKDIVMKMIEEDINRPIRINEFPLWRFFLFKLNEKDYLLYANFHHILFDAWSLDIFKEELSYFYQRRILGEKIDPEEDHGYKKFICWESNNLERIQNINDIIISQLVGEQNIRLPFSKKRGKVQDFSGKQLSFCLSREEGEKIKKISSESGVSIFVVLLSIFNVLLYKIGGNSAQTILSPFSNRLFTDIEKTIGCFINLLPVKTDIGLNEKFYDILIKNKNTIITLLEYQHIPYEKIIEKIDVERDLSKNPVSQILFSLQETNNDLFFIEKAVIKQTEAPIKFTRFDIEWQNWLVGERVEIKIIYNKNILSEEDVKSMFFYFIEFLDKVSDNISLSIRDLLFEPFNSIGRDNTTNGNLSKCVFEMIAGKFIESPQKCAVIDNNTCYSYADLGKKIDFLVSYLAEKEVSCNDIVAVIMPASIYLVVSVLSLLKIKTCFVLIDSSFPIKRINNILSSSKAKFILSNGDINCDSYPYSSPVIFVNEILYAYESNYKITLNNKTKPQTLADSDPAYICYTTGSSGFPKGVIVSRSALNNVVKEISSEVFFSRDDSLLSTTSISFDIFLLELLMPICSGGTVVFLDSSLKHNRHAISSCLEKNNITFMQGTPSFFHMLFADRWQCPRKLTFLCGGEEIKKKLAKEIIEDGHVLWNMYGPTETTIWASIKKLKKTDVEITIGKPIKNTVFYVLDERKNLLPKGNVGELYIAGVGLANGYLSKNKKKDCSFLYIDIFDDGNKVRAYRTGDYVREDKNGEYIYCGRVDGYIKINGYRVNIEEIEKTAFEHVYVEQAIVAPPLLENGELSLYIKIDKNLFLKEIDYSDYLSTLKTLFNDVYDVSRNINDKYLGWIDSVLQKKIPSVEMDEWLNFLIDDIMALNPKNVLEIGCGSGLLIKSINKSISKYYAVDISEQAIQRAIKSNAMLNNENKKINFYCGFIEDFLCASKEKFDTVIMISVVQYFPSIFYLVDIIKNTIKKMVPYGKIYIGDVRNILSLPLQNAQNIFLRSEDKDIFDNRELIIHPAFFYALPKFIPEITCVVVKPKLGVHTNELNRFRYDVILTVKGDKKENGNNNNIIYDWMSSKWTTEQVVQLLGQEKRHSLWIKNIRNRRTTYDDEFGLDAQELSYEIKRKINCKVELRIRSDIRHDCFDLLFSPDKLSSDEFEFFNSGPIDASIDNLYALETYATKPYLRSIIEPAIKRHLAESLPYYMIPKKMYFVKEFLLNTNGKVDKKNIKERVDFKLPEANKIETINNNENIVVKIWEDLLDKAPACNGDDFFYCGGHSLLAIKLLNEIESCIGINIPLFKFYETPTIDNLLYLIRETHEKGVEMTLKVNSSRDNIFLFPPIDGDLRWYISLIMYFRDSYNIFGFQYTTNLYEMSIIEIAKSYAAYIEREFRSGFYLFGWSYGALLAFEVAKHLDSEKTRVVLLDPPLNIYNKNKSCALQDDATKMGVNSDQVKIIQDFDSLNHISEDLLTRNDIVKNNLQNMFSYDITGQVDNMILFFPENSGNNIETTMKEEEKKDFWLKRCCGNKAVFCLNGDHYSILKSKTALLNIYERFNEFVEEEKVTF